MYELNEYCYDDGENICFHMDVEQRERNFNDNLDNFTDDENVE